MQVDIGKALAFDITPEQIEQMLSHETSRDRILYIGLRNILMDSHASAKRDDFNSEVEWRNESKAIAERTLAGLLAGEVMRRNARAPKADDFTNFARKHVLGLLPKERRKAMAEMPDKGAAELDAIFAKNEAKLRPIVQAALDAAIEAAKAKEELANELDLTV
jgi:hypothetical protein